MKKIKLILLSLIIVSVNAQELDPDFLKSLPEDIRGDLENKNAKKELDTENNYRPYLQSSKLKSEEELQTLRDRLKEDLKELEQRLDSNQNLNVNDGLKLYGLDFFNTFQTTFMPINEPNPDSRYILDVGDILEVQLVGQKSYIEDFLINRDGSISLPDIGKIIVAGLPLYEASRLIKSKIDSALIGADSFISLSEIRDVNILVSGNAKNPGIYTLSGNSNILHAISAAGGISEFGSLREINLVRDSMVIESLDVYDLLIEGQYDLKKRLRSGDIIFVESRKNIVGIDGAVNRPAYYEVIDEQNIYSIVEYANGIKRTADLQNISLERILDGTLKTIPVVNDSQFKTIKALDGDLVYIREHPYRKAKILGSVLKPGTYTMAAGETLDDLVAKAGGYTENAYIFGSIYKNEDAKMIEKKSKDVLYDEFLSNLLSLNEQNSSGTGTTDLSPIISLTREIKDTPSNGRVVVDLFDEDTANLYPVKEGDELFVPEKNNVVYIYGEVSTEGAVIYSPNEDVEYFVNKSGGFKKSADFKSIYVLHPNGESILYSKKRNIFERSPASEMKIYPGSVIFIPRQLDKSVPRRLALQGYVSILGDLGITLASLSAINN